MIGIFKRDFLGKYQ